MILFLQVHHHVHCGKYFIIIYIYINFLIFIIFRTIPSDVFKCKTLLDAIRCILNHNAYQKNNETLTEQQEQVFEIIEQLREHPQTMFMYLCKNFAMHFDIDLYIIAFDNGKFSLINKNNKDKKNMAFLSFNEDHQVCGPLYTVNDNGTMEIVFASDNADILLDVYMYVTELNHSSKKFFEYLY